jgi:hypothetical protein
MDAGKMSEQLESWMQLEWRATRGGVFHLDAEDFDVAVWIARGRGPPGRWQVRVLHRASGAKRFSVTRACAPIEEAKAAALDLITQMRNAVDSTGSDARRTDEGRA